MARSIQQATTARRDTCPEDRQLKVDGVTLGQVRSDGQSRFNADRPRCRSNGVTLTSARGDRSRAVLSDIVATYCGAVKRRLGQLEIRRGLSFVDALEFPLGPAGGILGRHPLHRIGRPVEDERRHRHVMHRTAVAGAGHAVYNWTHLPGLWT